MWMPHSQIRRRVVSQNHSVDCAARLTINLHRLDIRMLMKHIAGSNPRLMAVSRAYFVGPYAACTLSFSNSLIALTSEPDPGE